MVKTCRVHGDTHALGQAIGRRLYNWSPVVDEGREPGLDAEAEAAGEVQLTAEASAEMKPVDRQRLVWRMRARRVRARQKARQDALREIVAEEAAARKPYNFGKLIASGEIAEKTEMTQIDD